MEDSLEEGVHIEVLCKDGQASQGGGLIQRYEGSILVFTFDIPAKGRITHNQKMLPSPLVSGLLGSTSLWANVPSAIMRSKVNLGHLSIANPTTAENVTANMQDILFETITSEHLNREFPFRYIISHFISDARSVVLSL